MMKKIFLKKMACLLMLLFCTTIAHAAPVSILDLGGWFESGYVTWTGDNQNYTVYIKGGQYADFTAIDKELVRKYDGYYRGKNSTNRYKKISHCIIFRSNKTRDG